MSWYAIRTVYQFGTKRNGINVFEERIICFYAQTWPEAHSRAEAEAAEYARENGFKAHSEQYGYEQDGTALVDGYELWSELFEANASSESFYNARYVNFLYTPDEPEE
jgi:adenosine deaminase